MYSYVRMNRRCVARNDHSDDDDWSPACAPPALYYYQQTSPLQRTLHYVHNSTVHSVHSTLYSLRVHTSVSRNIMSFSNLYY